MIANVFIWRGGLRHWFAFDEPRFVVRQNGEFIGQHPPAGSVLRLVDTHAFSGMTLVRTAATLRRDGYHVVEMCADGAPLCGVTRLDPPAPRPPLISVAGMPGSGKSALAYMLAETLGARYVKWAHYVDVPGRYGEQAAEQEREDPFVFAKRVAAVVLKDDDALIVLDGIKDADALTFLAFATRRPLISLCVELPEHRRQAIVAARGDVDDAHDAERLVLFGGRLARLKAQSIIVDLMSQDHDDALAALALHGLRLTLPFRRTLLDKRASVWIPRYAATHTGKGKFPAFPPELVFHTSYSDTLGLDGDLRYRVNVVASAFRIIDDIVDEHEERRLRRPGGRVECMPTVWRTSSPWQAIMWASSMLAWAGRDPDPFYAEMVERVANATMIELAADAEGRKLTDEEYQQTLDKEVAFREWLARLTGRDIAEARKSAIRAQLENDRHGTGIEAARLPSY